MARALHVPDAAIIEGIASFPGLPHRQQVVARHAGIRFVNDSKATNADATSRAMGCYDRFIWIAGGIGKSGGITELSPYFARVAKAFLIGRDGPAFADTLTAHSVANDYVETLERAVPLAFDYATHHNVPEILFSPAAASFDQYANFEARGNAFAQLAKDAG